MAELYPRAKFLEYHTYSQVSTPQIHSLLLQYEHFLNQIYRSYDLPDDVFGPGESKPCRPKKKAAVAKKSESIAKKRSLDTSGVEVCQLQIWKRDGARATRQLKMKSNLKCLRIIASDEPKTLTLCRRLPHHKTA